MFKAGQIDATTAMTMLAQATSASGSAGPVVGGGDLPKDSANKKRVRSPTPEKTKEDDDDDDTEIDPRQLEPASHLDTFLCC